MTVPPLCRAARSCIHPMIPSWSLVPRADSGVHTDCCAFSLERPSTIGCPRVTSTTREKDAGSSDKDPCVDLGDAGQGAGETLPCRETGERTAADLEGQQEAMQLGALSGWPG